MVGGLKYHEKFKLVLFIWLVFILLGIGCVNAANDNDLDDLSLEDADFGPVQHDDVDFEELKTDDDGQRGQCECDSDRLDEPPLSLASLQNSINTCPDDIFRLEHNYSYDGGSDSIGGVEIRRDNLVIDGRVLPLKTFIPAEQYDTMLKKVEVQQSITALLTGARPIVVLQYIPSMPNMECQTHSSIRAETALTIPISWLPCTEPQRFRQDMFMGNAISVTAISQAMCGFRSR